MKEAVARQSVTGKDRRPPSTGDEVMATQTETSPCPAQQTKAESRQGEDSLFDCLFIFKKLGFYYS